MKRMHVHVSVANIDNAIDFYSALFAAKPAVAKNDYAKWMLDDPRMNFAISIVLLVLVVNYIDIFFYLYIFLCFLFLFSFVFNIFVISSPGN